MPTHNQLFASTDGGYQGSNAILNNSSEFYVDIGKTLSYATLDISDTSASPNLLSYGDVLGIEVIILNSKSLLGGGDELNTFDTSLFHTTDNGYSDAITTEINEEISDRVIGGTTNTWGKSWNKNDINGLKVRINNPTEPNGAESVALIGSFIFATITYIIPGPHIPTLTVATGRLNLQQGNITIS